MTKEKEELNKFIHTHKDLFDSCWHEPTPDNPHTCTKCNFVVPSHFSWSVLYYNPDYTSDFMTVWEHIKKKDWFDKFIDKTSYVSWHTEKAKFVRIDLINSFRICELVRDFLIEKEERDER